MSMDYCEFFKKIEANPYALVKDLTVREYLAAAEHVVQCPSCEEIVNKVVDEDDKMLKQIGFRPSDN